MILMMLELVDIKNDLVRSLGRNRRNDEMAIIDEGENDFVMAAYSNRLCNPTGRSIRRYSALSCQGNWLKGDVIDQ
jgi:hypothetical protein